MNARTASTPRMGPVIGLLLLLVTRASATPDSLSRRLLTCADSVRQLRESNRNPAALELIRRCLPAVAPAGTERAVGRLYIELALCERERGYFVTGIDAIQTATTWAERGRDTLAMARSRYILAMLYADQGDYARAVAQCHNNLSWHRQLPANKYVASTHLLLVAIYERLRNQPAADHHRDEYRRLVLQSGPLELRMLVYSNETKRLTERRQYRRALVNQRRAVSLARRLPADLMPDYLAGQLVDLAEIQRELHQCPAALASLNEAAAWGRKRWGTSTQARIFGELSAVKLAMDSLAEASAAGQQALHYARLSKRPDVVLVALKNLQRVQERTGAYQAALQTARDAYELFDSLSTVSKTQAIADIETRYGVARKEAAIQMLRKESTIQRLQADARQHDLQIANQQRRWLSIGIVALGLGLLLIAYLFRRAKHLQEKTEQQRQVLEEQAMQLHTANTTKDRLFSIIGHDLRNSVYQLHRSLVQRLPGMPGVAGETIDLQKAERAAYLLSQQINNLLYWALAQQGGLKAHLSTESLPALVADALEGFQVAFAQKSLHIVDETGPEQIRTDERLTLLVLRNLLHNALKFTPSGGQITLRSCQTAETVLLSICDTGPGLNATRDRAGRSSAEAGTGLGLLVAEELMQHCGGRLQLRAVRPHGTEVILEFPGDTQPVDFVRNSVIPLKVVSESGGKPQRKGAYE